MFSKLPDPPFGFFIARAHRALKNHIQRAFAEAGHEVTVEQMGVLTILWHKDGISQQDLVNMIHKAKSSITRLLDNMENRNLVVRIPDEHDKRNRLIYLTRKGRSLREALEDILQDTLQKATDGLTPDEIQTTKKVLTQLHFNLDQGEDHDGLPC